MYDTNKSGFLEKKEAFALFKELLFFHDKDCQFDQEEVGEEDYELLFDEIDSQGEGRISVLAVRRLIKEASGL